MARPRRVGRMRGRISATARRLPWRRIAIGTAVAVVLLVAVPPLRRAVSLGTSRAILWLASPITPTDSPAGTVNPIPSTAHTPP